GHRGARRRGRERSRGRAARRSPGREPARGRRATRGRPGGRHRRMLVTEEILEPQLPIVDPHHHLWDHPQSRYLLDELLADTGSGHHATPTVFVECMSMYRADGPDAMKPVGETEFVNGVAAMSASGRYGATRVAAAIVG